MSGENTRLEFTVTNDAGPSINQDDIYFTANGCVVANNSSESSSSTNAPFLVTGGAGIAETLYPPDVYQILPDVYQILPTRSYQILPDVQQIRPDVYQMSTRCLPDVYQMFTRSY